MCHRAGHYCGQWPQGPLGGCAWGWSLWAVGERIVGNHVNSLHPSHLVHATKGLTAYSQAGSQAGTEHQGQGRESHSWGGRCLQLVAAVTGAEKAGKGYVRQGSRRVHHFLLPFVLVLKPHFCLVIKSIFQVLGSASRDLMGFPQAQ